MSYPRRSPFLLYNRIDEDSFRIHNILDAKSYQLNLEFVSFLRQLNGRRDPYTIFPRHSKWYIRQLIRELKHCGMLAPEKSLVRLGFGCYIFPLFYCYFGRIAKKLAKLWNYFLLLACIPVLILGIRTQTYILTHPYLLAYGVKNVKACLIPGLLLGLSIAAICHELSHAYVALAYKGHIYIYDGSRDTFLYAYCFCVYGYKTHSQQVLSNANPCCGNRNELSFIRNFYGHGSDAFF